MLQKEFESRVGMQVSNDEYAAIETVYINCDLDKDDFCKMWCKMNKSRIILAKDEAKKKETAKNTVRNLYNRIEVGDLTPAIDIITDDERKALGYFDIRVWNEAWNCENTITDIWNEINKLYQYGTIA